MQPLLQHLFQVSSLEDVSRQRLEAFVEEYPSFGIGHYLLSRKLRSEGSDRFMPETQKTSLYFTNPFWLHWQLDHLEGGGKMEPVAREWEPAAEVAVLAEVPAAVEAPAAAVQEAEPLVADAPVGRTVVAEEPVVTEAEKEPVVAEVAQEPIRDEEGPFVLEEGTEPVTAAANAVTVAEESYDLTGDELQGGQADAAEGPSAADQLLRSIAEARGLRESLHKINEEPVVAEEPIRQEEEPIQDEEAPFVLDEAGPQIVSEPGFELEVKAEAHVAHEANVSREANVLHEANVSQEANVLPEAQPANDLVFEPYHTIDYFASQGIKFTQDENPTDVLGKQLKSFTDWLKGMRRLPQKDREVVPDRVAEQAIQSFAAHSIEGKDVLTETMADVLAKQGMRERARVVYEKLSLLNPDKSAYFAAKIEQLNIR